RIAAASKEAHPSIGRVDGNERLGEQGEARSLRRDIAGERLDLVDRRRAIQDDRLRLHARHGHGLVHRFELTRSQPAPKPPPPGVSIVMTSDVSTSSVTFAGSSRPLTRFRPGAPADPPRTPAGACRRRSEMSDSRHGSSTRSSRTTPSPPGWAPPPPEP